MPKVFLKCTRRFSAGEPKKMEETSLNEKRSPKGERNAALGLLRWWEREGKSGWWNRTKKRRIELDLTAHEDWSTVSDLSIVTRWDMFRVPQVFEGEYHKPSRKLPRIVVHPPFVDVDLLSTTYNLRPERAKKKTPWPIETSAGKTTPVKCEKKPRLLPAPAPEVSQKVALSNKSPPIIAATPRLKRIHECPYCKKMFDRPWVLKGHIRRHTGERPFKCPVCEKSFADRSNLRAHQRTRNHHEWEWKCRGCGKPFSQRRYMERHQVSTCQKHVAISANDEPSP